MRFFTLTTIFLYTPNLIENMNEIQQAGENAMYGPKADTEVRQLKNSNLSGDWKCFLCLSE